MMTEAGEVIALRGRYDRNVREGRESGKKRRLADRAALALMVQPHQESTGKVSEECL